MPGWRQYVVVAELMTFATRVDAAGERVQLDAQPASEHGVPSRPVAIWPMARLAILEVIPSPLLALGSHGSRLGVRWQLTPFSYSFGITERRLRYFLVSPVARHVGSIEIYLSPEWICCVAPSESGWLARVGSRVFLPVLERGEVVAVSLGGSYAYANGRHSGSAEFGVYTFSSIVGLSLTLTPRNETRAAIVALSLRYY